MEIEEKRKRKEERDHFNTLLDILAFTREEKRRENILTHSWTFYHSLGRKRGGNNNRKREQLDTRKQAKEK